MSSSGSLNCTNTSTPSPAPSVWQELAVKVVGQHWRPKRIRSSKSRLWMDHRPESCHHSESISLLLREVTAARISWSPWNEHMPSFYSLTSRWLGGERKGALSRASLRPAGQEWGCKELLLQGTPQASPAPHTWPQAARQALLCDFQAVGTWP